jgi:hypothetical protein
MATVSELLPYLEQGHTLHSARGESLRLLAPDRVEWIRARGYRFEQEFISLDHARAIHDVWDWSVRGHELDGGQI